ncbi:MAG TPA: hypothetical protein DDY43_04340 [Synechococcales bacterium UBA10510]|nr:hypothetical protein [Synechococcales bacterium UBA10510]
MAVTGKENGWEGNACKQKHGPGGKCQSMAWSSGEWPEARAKSLIKRPLDWAHWVGPIGMDQGLRSRGYESPLGLG